MPPKLGDSGLGPRLHHPTTTIPLSLRQTGHAELFLIRLIYVLWVISLGAGNHSADQPDEIDRGRGGGEGGGGFLTAISLDRVAPLLTYSENFYHHFRALVFGLYFSRISAIILNMLLLPGTWIAKRLSALSSRKKKMGQKNLRAKVSRGQNIRNRDEKGGGKNFFT